MPITIFQSLCDVFNLFVFYNQQSKIQKYSISNHKKWRQADKLKTVIVWHFWLTNELNSDLNC